jgi:ABC-2 type transport system ATP-binding protein
MWDTIKSLAKSGITVFLTTQYLEEADQLADTIAVLSKGKIVAQGTPAELKRLLPHGRIELRFRSLSDLGQAQKALRSYQTEADNDTRSLLVTTDGTVKQAAKLFGDIQVAQVSVEEFSQKIPTLDEAFLKIINEAKGSK